MHLQVSDARLTFSTLIAGMKTLCYSIYNYGNTARPIPGQHALQVSHASIAHPQGRGACWSDPSQTASIGGVVFGSPDRCAVRCPMQQQLYSHTTHLCAQILSLPTFPRFSHLAMPAGMIRQMQRPWQLADRVWSHYPFLLSPECSAQLMGCMEEQ